MNFRNQTAMIKVLRGGFSLIEVLVAVVVLSVGLLALAALQGQLVRGSAAAKTQSQGMALAQEKLEQLRGFTGANGATNSYDAIQPTTDTVVNGANTFTRTVTVDRYVLNLDSGCDNTSIPAFQKVSAWTCPATVPLATGGINEYKRVIVNVSSTNESGQPSTVEIGDVISVASPSDAVKTLAAPNNSHSPPQVWIDPSKFAPGIIPIALGGGKSAAASDPQPETFSTGHITTRFSVQNYNTALNTKGLVLLTKQFDFAATSCTCNMAGVSTVNAPAYGPTYWNGSKYITPAAIPSSSSGTGKITGSDPVAGGNANNSSQDPILCQACCRDHHDNATVQLDANNNPLLFDAFRPTAEHSGGDHKHYDTDSGNNLLTAVVTGSGSEYFETCRFVRVDGINFVATDAREENHINVAPINRDTSITVSKQTVSCDPAGDTITSGSCFDHQIDSTTIDSGNPHGYPAFVKDYVNAFYTAWQIAVTAGKYPLAASSVTPGVGDLLLDASGNPTTLANSYTSLINPAPQTVLSINTNNVSYHEGRGIYIDYISPETSTALACIGKTTDPDCFTYASSTVLQVLPFVAVNQTFLDSWRRGAADTAIAVTNASIPTGGTFDPFIIGYDFDRGTVTGLGTSTTNNNAITQARLGNAGLIDSVSIQPSYPFEAFNCTKTSPCSADPPDSAAGDAYDSSVTSANGPRFQADRQPYAVSGTTSNIPFGVSTTDNSGLRSATIGNPIAISVTAPTLNPSSLTTCTLGKGNKQPYTCYGTSTATTVTILFASYNTLVSCTPHGPVTCPNPPTVNDYKVCSITGLPGGNFVTLATPFTVVNAGTSTEQTSITLTIDSTKGKTITDVVSALSLTANFYLQSQTCP